MLIVTAQNVTADGQLSYHDGTADYDIWVGINDHMIWMGTIHGHVRDEGASKLLRLLADKMDSQKR